MTVNRNGILNDNDIRHMWDRLDISDYFQRNSISIGQESMNKQKPEQETGNTRKNVEKLSAEETGDRRETHLISVNKTLCQT